MARGPAIALENMITARRRRWWIIFQGLRGEAGRLRPRQDRQAPFRDGKSVQSRAFGAQLAPFRALFGQVEETSMKNAGKIDKKKAKNGAKWRFLEGKAPFLRGRRRRPQIATRHPERLYVSRVWLRRAQGSAVERHFFTDMGVANNRHGIESVRRCGRLQACRACNLRDPRAIFVRGGDLSRRIKKRDASCSRP